MHNFSLIFPNIIMFKKRYIRPVDALEMHVIYTNMVITCIGLCYDALLYWKNINVN